MDGGWAVDMVERRYNESKTTYKLIVMDMYMPTLNGVKATE